MKSDGVQRVERLPSVAIKIGSGRAVVGATGRSPLRAVNAADIRSREFHAVLFLGGFDALARDFEIAGIDFDAEVAMPGADSRDAARS